MQHLYLCPLELQLQIAEHVIAVYTSDVSSSAVLCLCLVDSMIGSQELVDESLPFKYSLHCIN